MAIRLLFIICFNFSSLVAMANPQPRTFLEPYEYKGGAVPVAFFDADSTLRISTGQYFAPLHGGEVVTLPDVAAKIKEVSDSGFFVAIVSNQVSTSHRTSRDKINEAFAKTIEGAKAEGGSVHYFDYSVTEHESKPHVWMADQLEAKLKKRFGKNAIIDRQRSFMVGDAAYLKPVDGMPGDIRPDGREAFDRGNFDRLFAENNRIKFHEPHKFFGWEKFGVDRMHRQPDVDAYLEKKFSWLKSDSSCGRMFFGFAPSGK